MKFPFLSQTFKLLKFFSKAKEKRGKKSKLKNHLIANHKSQISLYDKIEEIISIPNINFNSLEIVVKIL